MSKSEAPFAYEGLDRAFHEKARLGIMSSLIGRADGLSFSELKSFCGLTDGNLNRHLQLLEEVGYIDFEKGFEGRRPRTMYCLTSEGRARFFDYLDELEKILRKAASARRRNASLNKGIVSS